MKEYLDSFLKGAKHVADVLLVKTSETVDAAKLELEIRKVQNSLDKEYKALGQIMFQVEKGSLKKDEKIIKTACQRIQDSIDALMELQKKKEEMKEQEEEETVFEPDMPEEEQDEEEIVPEETEEVLKPERDEEGYFVLKFCPECKVGNHPEASRCVNCGAEFSKKDDAE